MHEAVPTSVQEAGQATLPACGLSESLRNLDECLLRHVQTEREETGRSPGSDPFRGLYIEEEDVGRILRGKTAMSPGRGLDSLAVDPNFARLAAIYGLNACHLDIVLVAFAPELDSRYERIYAYLHDDVSRKRPSVELMARLLTDSALSAGSLREWLGAAGPLLRHGIIRLADSSLPLARREVLLHPRIAAFLCGDDEIDEELSSFCTLTRAPAAGAPAGADPGIVRLARSASATRSHLVLNFSGENERAKRESAVGLAAELGVPFLELDLERAARNGADIDARMRAFARETMLRSPLVFCRGMDRIPEESIREGILRSVCGMSPITIIASQKPWHGNGMHGMIALTFNMPGWPARRRAWRAVLRKRGVRIRATALDRLAECFRFTEAQVDDAAQAAATLAGYREQPIREEHLFEVARSHSGHGMGNLAHKVQPVHRWDDIVLPDEASSQLREICKRVTLRHQVLGKWGFERKLSGGIGVNALFHGHAGTGKTMAAEVVARELQLDLYKIDLAGIVSKYIGETEKNLDRIFQAATTANAILLFDEADALFGKRSEVRDSHDRYANLEISYLLQRMEQYEGVAILATNLKQNLDDAFLRRLAFSVNFPFPDEISRRRIWTRIWPKQTPLGADVDLDWLSERFLLSGGHIRNVALAAAFLAIEHDGPVVMTDILRAVRAEFQKMGKSVSSAELELPMPVAAGVVA